MQMYMYISNMYIYKYIYICVFGLNTTSRYNIQKANHHHPCRTSSGLKSLIYVQSPRPYTPDWTCRLGTCSLIAFSPCVITHAWRYICAPDPWKAWNSDPQMIYTWNISLNVFGGCFFLIFLVPSKTVKKPWKTVKSREFHGFFHGLASPWISMAGLNAFGKNWWKKDVLEYFCMNFTALSCCFGYQWWISRA